VEVANLTPAYLIIDQSFVCDNRWTNISKQRTFRSYHIDYIVNSEDLKVHKNENLFGFDFEFCTISLLVRSKY
jgi:hypothetical protein